MAEYQMSLLTEVGERISSDFFKAGLGGGDVREEILYSLHLLSVAWGCWGHLCLCMREFIDKAVGRVDTEGGRHKAERG